MPHLLHNIRRNFLPAVALLLLYWAAAMVGLNWAATYGAGSPVWPAAGVGMAGLLLGGAHLWPSILIGRLAAALAMGSSLPIWADVIIAGGNALGALLPVLVLRHVVRIDLRLVAMRDILWLAAGGALGAAIAAAIGTAAVHLAEATDFLGVNEIATNWWFGNAVGTLTVTSLILAWWSRAIPPMRVRDWLHFVVLILTSTFFAYAIFVHAQWEDLHTWFMFPILIWAALSFQMRGAGLVLLIVSGLATWGATLGVGPFAGIMTNPEEEVIVAQQFAAATSLTILVLAAAADERRGKEALTRLNAELERRVEEGAARLVQFQKMESIGQLTGGIAHDFNNLLMAVLGSLDLLRKRLPPGDERAERLLENASGAARRGAMLTRRLLAFARKQELRPEPVDVPALIFGMAELLSRSLGPQIKIETHLALGLPRALVDANQLEMAVLNLALNARDAMPEGGVLTISADVIGIENDPDMAPGSYIRLRLTDNGIGMDQETLRRAVEPFFTTKGLGKGTGLGLSMIHGLAAQSGGDFSLQSEPGRGTTAQILLPVTTAADEREESSPGAGENEATGSGTRKLTVLVVDDDALVLIGTLAMLEDLGHAAIEASSASEALKVLHSGRGVEVVLTDQAMPAMTGMELAAAIRAVHPEIPVILASGYADLPENLGDAIAARLSKPFGQDELACALARVAAAAPQPAAPRREKFGEPAAKPI